jgi:hypothetical protein
MARSCSVCTLPLAGAINEALQAGRSARAVAGEYGLSYYALTRHARNHGSRILPAKVPAARIADPLDELTAALRIRALAGNPADTREYRLALAAQSAALHATAPPRSLAAEPEWIALRATMLRALEDHPAARLAIAAALTEAGV